MFGELFRYAHDPRTGAALSAFESGHLGNGTCLLFITGLTGGLLDLGYLDALDHRLRVTERASLVQCVLPSSYLGYGVSSLEEDGRCIDELLRKLVNARGKRRIILMGHSTGCQVWS